MLLVLWIPAETTPLLETQQIPFPTLSACEAAARILERDMHPPLNVHAICLDRRSAIE